MNEPGNTLAERQAAFMRAILDENAPLPEGWGNSQAAGMAVYRGNYRSALMGALENTFERTRRYVGEQAFAQASIHHALSHPPSGWTIDEAGAGFEQTCAELFSKNPEVAELAWLEWSMLELATAPNTASLGPAEFASASAEFRDDDWMNLRLQPAPRAQARLVTSNLTELWNALEEDATVEATAQSGSEQGCLVWREGERPTFLLREPDSAVAFQAIQREASYGDLIMLLAGDEPDDSAVQNAAMRAGAILGVWLQEGLIVGMHT